MQQVDFAGIVAEQDAVDRTDYIVPRRDLRFDLQTTAHGTNDFTVRNPADGRYVSMTDYAVQAYAASIHIPLSHWRRIRSKRTDEFDDLALDTLRILHRDTVSRSPDTNLMMRSVAPPNSGWQDTTVRALVSDSYLRRDNVPFLDMISKHISNDVEIKQYVSSDRHLRIKLLFNGNDDFGHGIIISNSEVGCGAREINGFVWIRVCDNGMIVSEKNWDQRTIHRSKRQGIGYLDAPAMETDDEILDQIARQMDQVCSPDYFDGIVDQIDTSQSFTLNIEKAQAWFTAQKMPKTDVAAITERMQVEIAAGNGSGDDVSVWGMSQAVTNYAHTSGSGYERQHRLERLGYDIVSNAVQIGGRSLI